MGYNGWLIPLRLQGIIIIIIIIIIMIIIIIIIIIIMVVLSSQNKYLVQDDEYNYHDSLQVNLIEKNCPLAGSTKSCSGKSP